MPRLRAAAALVGCWASRWRMTESSTRASSRPDAGGEVVAADARARRHGEHEAVHLVLELADVARPGVELERAERVRGDAARAALLLALEAAQERLHETGNVPR